MRALLALVVLTLLAGCLEDAAAPEAPPRDEVETDAASLRPVTQRFEGTVSGTPVEAGALEFTFDVPQGAVGVNGSLAWDPPLVELALELVDPYGNVVDEGYADADGHLVVTTVDLPPSGTWTFRVSSAAPVPVDFTLDAVAELIVPADNEVVKRTRLDAGGFYEVNVIMEANATFRFSFNGSAPLHWDVHSHPDGKVKYWQEGTDASKASEFTAPARGIYSLLFANEAEGLQAPGIDLAFEMRGAFRMHSHAQ